MEIELKPATKYERKIFYKEEWNYKDIPDFITESITSREFGFDHIGNGPNDRYKVFRDGLHLGRFIKVKQPFAAYVSVAYYNKPQRREGWQMSELVFDVDAKDIPVRTCECSEGQVCDKCLNQAKDIVLMINDTLKSDLGLHNINMVYSGRGYHVRVLDENVMEASSDLRGDIVQYIVGAKIPQINTSSDATKLKPSSIPYGYPKNFIKWSRYSIDHLTKDTKIDVNRKLLLDTLKYRSLLSEFDYWGPFIAKIGPRRINDLMNAISRINMGITDTKVSIDLKRILRLPSTLHSKVSMKSTLIKNIETFDPFDDAVPEFVYDRK
ncbi:MAG: DNA primase catalytic subunit PriS [Methanosphaera sp.]|nr:DNA primase catalytic subunit PriS [Methanosphaera sp.]